MKLKAFAIATGAAVSLLSGVAQATTFDFSYTDFDGTVVSGMITADLSSTPGQYTATSITGTRGLDTITGLSGYASADNIIFYPNQPYVDVSGLSFTYGSSADAAANFYYDSDSSRYMELIYPDPGTTGDGQVVTNVTFTMEGPVGTVPLPASAPLFGAALLALGAIGYGLKRKAAAA